MAKLVKTLINGKESEFDYDKVTDDLKDFGIKSNRFNRRISAGSLPTDEPFIFIGFDKHKLSEAEMTAQDTDNDMAHIKMVAKGVRSSDKHEISLGRLTAFGQIKENAESTLNPLHLKESKDGKSFYIEGATLNKQLGDHIVTDIEYLLTAGKMTAKDVQIFNVDYTASREENKETLLEEYIGVRDVYKLEKATRN
jgi:hypothetical protein